MSRKSFNALKRLINDYSRLLDQNDAQLYLSDEN